MLSFSPHAFLRNARGEMRQRSEGRGGKFADAGLVGRPPPSFALLRTPPPPAFFQNARGEEKVSFLVSVRCFPKE